MSTITCFYCEQMVDLTNVSLAMPFGCPHCNQLIHTPQCACDTCDIERQLDLGLSALARMKQIRREDEAERKRLDLPVEQNRDQPSPIGKPAGRTIIRRGGETYVFVTMEQVNSCPNCGHEVRPTWRFCSKCGKALHA